MILVDSTSLHLGGNTNNLMLANHSTDLFIMVTLTHHVNLPPPPLFVTRPVNDNLEASQWMPARMTGNKLDHVGVLQIQTWQEEDNAPMCPHSNWMTWLPTVFDEYVLVQAYSWQLLHEYIQEENNTCGKQKNISLPGEWQAWAKHRLEK